jgi:hypothetical protein
MTLDLSGPERPQPVAELDLQANAQAVRLRDTTAIVMLDSALVTVDVSDPAAPLLLDRVNIQDGASTLAVDGFTAVVGSRDSGLLTLIDTATPSDLVVLSEFLVLSDQSPSSIDELKVLDHTAFVLGSFWMYVVDIRNPRLPVRLYDRAAQYATALDFQGGFAFLGVQSRVEALDITDPAHPQVVRTYNDIAAYNLDAISENLLAARGAGYFICDFSNLDNPLVYDAPWPFRWWWPAGALIDSTWIRPSAHVIDVMTLECRPPEAEIRTAGRGPTIWFEDLSRYQVTERVWDFGDGETSSALNPIHTYAEPGPLLRPRGRPSLA